MSQTPADVQLQLAPKRDAGARADALAELRRARATLHAAVADALQRGVANAADVLALRHRLHGLRHVQTSRTVVDGLGERRRCEADPAAIHAEAARLDADAAAWGRRGVEAHLHVLEGVGADASPSRDTEQNSDARTTALGERPRAADCTPGAGTRAGRAAAVAERFAGEAPAGDAPVGEDAESAALTLVALKQELLRRLELGESFTQAVEATGLRIGKRALRRMRAAVKKGGVKALRDGRARNGREAVFPPELGTLLLNLYQQHRSAGPAALHAALVEAWGNERPVPSKSWVKYFLSKQDPALLLILRQGVTGWNKRMAPRGTATGARRINERWQIDDCRTDLWVRIPQRDGTFDVAELWITVIMDVHSRAIVSIVFSLNAPNAWTAMRALRKAILPKDDSEYPMQGLPERLVMDRGKHFVSKKFLTAVRELGIVVELCAPRNPNDKSELERWFGTMQRGRLATIPGYKRGGMKSVEAARKAIHELKTLEWVKVAIEHWIVRDYHLRDHAGLADAEFDWSPLNRWRAGGAVTHVDPAKLVALLPYMKREYVVGKKGIHLKYSGALHTYWAPALAHQVGRRARVRALPGDRHSILISFADTPGDGYIEACWMEGPNPRYTTADVVAARHRVRDGLLDRVDDIARAAEQSAARSPAAWVQAAEEEERLAVAEARVQARAAEPTAEDVLLDDLEAQSIARGLADAAASVTREGSSAHEHQSTPLGQTAGTRSPDDPHHHAVARIDDEMPAQDTRDAAQSTGRRAVTPGHADVGARKPRVPLDPEQLPAHRPAADERDAIERLASALPPWRADHTTSGHALAPTAPTPTQHPHDEIGGWSLPRGTASREPVAPTRTTALQNTALPVLPAMSPDAPAPPTTDIISLAAARAKRAASSQSQPTDERGTSALDLLHHLETQPITPRAEPSTGETASPTPPASLATTTTGERSTPPSRPSATPAPSADDAVLALLRAM